MGLISARLWRKWGRLTLGGKVTDKEEGDGPYPLQHVRDLPRPIARELEAASEDGMTDSTVGPGRLAATSGAGSGTGSASRIPWSVRSFSLD